MKIAVIITHSRKGSAGTFERMHEIIAHLNKYDVTATLLTPIEEDAKNVIDIPTLIIPSNLSKIKLATFTYGLTRKLISSSMTSRFILSKLSIDKMVGTIYVGLKKILVSTKFDILHAVQPIAGLACVKLSKELGLPLVSEFNNIWPEELVSQGLIKRHDATYERIKAIEKEVMDGSDTINVVSDFMKDYVVKNYSVNRNKIVVVPAAGPILTKAHNVNRKNNIVYAGMVNPRSNVQLFLNAIPYSDSHSSFFITDRGDELQKIKKIVKENNLNVSFFWYPTHEQVLEFLMMSKVGIATFQHDITWKTGIPLKPFDYLACGLPIVVNEVGNWWSDVIKQENVGLVTNGEPDDFAKKMDSLIYDDNNWLKMHENALRVIENKYNWKIVVQDIILPMYEKLFQPKIN